ncbi:hypothetical protein GQX74_006179 [Glossina fuscipes]|nr:hypothetical protein GQX74_006179 [Glossina fuscipes]
METIVWSRVYFGYVKRYSSEHVAKKFSMLCKANVDVMQTYERTSVSLTRQLIYLCSTLMQRCMLNYSLIVKHINVVYILDDDDDDSNSYCSLLSYLMA